MSDLTPKITETDKPKIGDTVLLRGKILEDIGNTYTIGWSGANFSPRVPDTAIVKVVQFCMGYPECDGDLPGEEHSNECIVAARLAAASNVEAAEKIIKQPVVPVPAIVEVERPAIKYPCGCSASAGSPSYCPEHGSRASSLIAALNDPRYSEESTKLARDIAAAVEMEKLREALKLVKIRYGILRNRMEACGSRGKHGVSLLEIPAWIEDIDDLLAATAPQSGEGKKG